MPILGWPIRFLAYKPHALHAVAGSTLKHWRALVFSAYGRKPKPPAMRAGVDSSGRLGVEHPRAHHSINGKE